MISVGFLVLHFMRCIALEESASQPLSIFKMECPKFEKQKVLKQQGRNPRTSRSQKSNRIQLKNSRHRPSWFSTYIPTVSTSGSDSERRRWDTATIFWESWTSWENWLLEMEFYEVSWCQMLFLVTPDTPGSGAKHSPPGDKFQKSEGPQPTGEKP